jgi:hypothetical protein
MAHEMSDFIDSVKESLTDAQYKEGMELCQKIFKKKESQQKLYRMTYLRPHTFSDDHCDDEECMDMKFYIAFRKVQGLILLSEARFERIKEENVFRGTQDELSQFIDYDILRSFPHDNEELGNEIEWYEFPVLSLEEVNE